MIPPERNSEFIANTEHLLGDTQAVVWSTKTTKTPSPSMPEQLTRAGLTAVMICAAFDAQTKKISLPAEGPNINFQVNGTPVFVVEETKDAMHSYLLHRLEEYLPGIGCINKKVNE